MPPLVGRSQANLQRFALYDSSPAPYWVIFARVFRVGRAFATPLGSYLERAPSFDERGDPASTNQPSSRSCGTTASREATAWLAASALFWGKRVYDFFKARVATEGTPTWVKAEVAISWTTRNFGDGFKLL